MGNVEKRGLRIWLQQKLKDALPVTSRQTDRQSAGNYFNYCGKVPIHYRTVGQGPLPILFLHGFASSSTTWQELTGLFPDEEYSLFLLDLKGFGLSAKPKDGAYSIEDQAELVKAFILEKGFCSLILVGHSLGGAVALRVSIDVGMDDGAFRVAKLVLIDSAAYPQRLPRFFRRLRSPLGPLLLRLMPVRKLVQGVLERVYFDKSAITAEKFERYTSYFRGKGISYALRATVMAIDPEAFARIGESYRSLKLPVLIIWGAEDRNVRLSLGQRLHGDLSGSRLKILEKCGHNPHEERPEETYLEISAFLRDR